MDKDWRSSTGGAQQARDLPPTAPSRPALDMLEERLQNIHQDLDSLRRTAQAIRAHVFSDVPEGDPPSNAKPREVGPGFIGRIEGRLGDVSDTINELREHINRLTTLG